MSAAVRFGFIGLRWIGGGMSI